MHGLNLAPENADRDGARPRPSVDLDTYPTHTQLQITPLNRPGFSSAFYRRMGLCHASIRSNFGSGLIACLSRPATRWRRRAVDAVATDIDAMLTIPRRRPVARATRAMNPQWSPAWRRVWIRLRTSLASRSLWGHDAMSWPRTAPHMCAIDHDR